MSWQKVASLALVIVIVLTAYAIGAGKSSKNLVLCANKKSGDLSLASAKGRCGKGEKKLTVAKEGPVGAAGAPGADGAPGKDGTPADLAGEPTHLVAAHSGLCKLTPGTFCGQSGSWGGAWENYGAAAAPAGYWKDAGGVVHLQGAVTVNYSGIGGNPDETDRAFYLPVGYRPLDGTRAFTTYSYCNTPANGIGRVQILTNGAVLPDVSGQDRCTALDNITFRP